jgi:ABC-type Na+ efflux pump permease subunit
MFVLFLVVAMTTPQLLNSVLEEKMSRISEVLLGSVTPFELMLGKLLASTAVSAVMTLVYLTGGAWAAHRWGYLDVLDPSMVAWFVLFLILAVLMYGSFFIAIGAACSDLKDAQNLMAPAMTMLMIPALTWTLVTRAPQSAFAVGASLFPPATPFLMLLRLALPERPPAWQVAAGVVVTLLATVAIVWAAGRIVRTGLLMQGKGVTMGEMWRWIRA